MKVAQASYCVNDIKLMKKCWYEAFLSNSTIPNYLRLFADEKVTKKYKDIAEKRIKQLPISNNHYKQHISEDTEDSITEIEYKYLHFFRDLLIRL